MNICVNFFTFAPDIPDDDDDVDDDDDDVVCNGWRRWDAVCDVGVIGWPQSCLCACRVANANVNVLCATVLQDDHANNIALCSDMLFSVLWWWSMATFCGHVVDNEGCNRPVQLKHCMTDE